MEIELARHNWAGLRSFADSATLPDAVRALVAANDTESAKAAYWRIDNVALLDGCLTEAATAVAASVVQALSRLSEPSLAYALELLAQISGGYVHKPSEQGLGPVSVEECVHEVSLAFPFFCELLEVSGVSQICASCVDLITSCGRYERTLTERARYVLSGALDLPGLQSHRELILDSLRDLS
ncbi:hypothetical protein [Amycolatopsis sp. SID8362]|uniref:hypothetical protein n=1 Tax=Amycolatopsis sp. SID8362 TaxID=2690346 RepID=UPI0013718646|nr:hypothetical protein [Amycolatopsis sp. SID8362]NBH08282.1 hypothetical protein [Amycolatopsis sp. SID8362]NED44977.1 hypothetical protein [Amycolatopsis sp. SID8362]